MTLYRYTQAQLDNARRAASNQALRNACVDIEKHFEGYEGDEMGIAADIILKIIRKGIY